MHGRPEPMREPQPDSKVTICACTYRRPEGLKALLGGIERQTFAQIRPPELDIVIADNEGATVARRICQDFQHKSNIPVTYVHEQRRGISHARNACLSQVAPQSDFLAMIDDDEIPEPDWIEQLLLAQARSNADVVQGQVEPVFANDVPAWIREKGFFGWPPKGLNNQPPGWMDGQSLGSAATNNVLVRWQPVRQLGLRFDPRLALTGGEDAVFFRRLRKAGLTISYAEKAKVREIVPEERACLNYLLREQYKRGGLRLRKKLLLQSEKLSGPVTLWMSLRIATRGCAMIVTGLGSALGSCFTGKEKQRRLAMNLMRSANGLGMLASTLGLRYQHYEDKADT